jgi:hypothetical protein
MFGPPREGGLGLFPFKIHTFSRHACLLTRTLCLLLSASPPPYAILAKDLLYSHAPHYSPLALLTLGRSIAFAKSLRVLRPQVEALLSPSCSVSKTPLLNRLYKAFATLPPPQDVHPHPLLLGSWMWATPIWGNPYFMSHEGCVLEVSFSIVATHTIIPMLDSLVCACNSA